VRPAGCIGYRSGTLCGTGTYVLLCINQCGYAQSPSWCSPHFGIEIEIEIEIGFGIEIGIGIGIGIEIESNRGTNLNRIDPDFDFDPDAAFAGF
jgi:hypothetical protein